jgi:CRISPR-associated protein Csd1
MNWIETLYRTYENCAGCVGNENDKIPLVPVAHVVQQTHIEITINQDGDFQRARVEPLVTVIPCSEDSAGRTNSPVAHPLADKLKYVASDFFALTGEKPKNPGLNPHYDAYFEAVKSWAESKHGHPKIHAVLKYLKTTNGKVLNDLCKAGIYPLSDSGLIQKKWLGDKDSAPAIYESTKTYPAPWDIFVRWKVTIPGTPEDRTYWDKSVWDSWTDCYLSTPSTTGLCFATGGEVRLAAQHPKKIRNIADGSKLISSNDSSGFTFRGRFTDPKGSQACGVSFDVTQKAHNALRWLIARQGRRDGDQAIVAWAVSGKDVPPIVADTFSLLSEEDDYVASEADESPSGSAHAEVAQDFALRLKHKIGGYQAELGNTEKIVVLALDSATPGRMSMTYYRELASSEFLQRLERWHAECAWFQNFGQKRHFVGAASPKDIATCAYGTRLDDKLLAATHRRLLPCIIESAPLPKDIVESCIRRATARMSMDHWEWKKCLGIACSLYRKQQNDLQLHQHTMALERERKTRDYLYGRLLAIADRLESSAMTASEKRESNAARFMQRFADHPFSTWRTIELSLVPYEQRLRANAPGLLAVFKKERQEVMELFTADQFEKDGKLSGEFLLAYHSQSAALWKKQPKDTDDDSNDSNDSTTLES